MKGTALLLLMVVIGGCASVQYRAPDQVEYLTPTASFRMYLPPFSHADVPMGSQIAVVGTTERNGRTYRVVRLPDSSASLLNILVNDDGSFEGSAISAMNGSMMGATYQPDPASVRLVPLGHMAAPREMSDAQQATQAPASVASESAVPQESTDWANVPCDIVIEAKRAECESEHDRLGIPKDSSEASAAPATHATSSCGYAGNGYRPIVDLNGVDPDRFECDLSDCQGYASHINPAQNAVAGAVGGAILGAAIGALIGDHSSYARFGAGVGAVQGGVAGAAGSVAAQVNVVRNCMVGRGYRVLQ